MGTRERHIGNAAARSAPVADPRGGRLFAMPRFLVGITHQVYRYRVFAIAGVITALFLMLLAVLPALFAFDPKLSNAVPAYSEVSEEVVDALVSDLKFQKSDFLMDSMLSGSARIHKQKLVSLVVYHL